jgi:hypothetical protein
MRAQGQEKLKNHRKWMDDRRITGWFTRPIYQRQYSGRFLSDVFNATAFNDF